MRQREQTGQIVAIGQRWHVRYWQRQTANGQLVRKRVTHPLGIIENSRPSKDILRLAREHMQTVNDSAIPPEQILSLVEFVETVFLPRTRVHKRPSTAKTYGDSWRNHLRPAISCVRTPMRYTRTVECQAWLNQASKNGLGKNSLKHVQSCLSAAFSLAKQLGYFDGANPVQGTRIDPSAAAPEDGYAYSLEEVQAILSLLPAPANVVFAVAAFAGLRFGELCGLDWSDVHDGELWIGRSVWNGHVGEPKTKKSRAPVPIIPTLARYLDVHCLRAGNPTTGPVFANSLGGRLDLHNLLARVILPTLNRCATCHKSEHEHKLHPARFADHEYVRDGSLPEWHGWHACRRGLASNLNRLGIDDSVIQRILRHSTVAVTQACSIKTSTPEVHDAMGKLEHELAAQTAARTAVQGPRDSFGTLKPASGALPETVN